MADVQQAAGTIEAHALAKHVRMSPQKARLVIDLIRGRKVQDALQNLEAGAPPVIVLDLSKLTFLDSTGLRCLVTADQRARDGGRRLVIVRGPDAVQRVFAITRLEERLEIVDDASAVI